MNTIQTTVDAIKARAQQERDAEHQRWKDRLHLDEHAARARQRVTDLAARASEFAAILKEHDIPSADQDAILQAHPGLQPWFDNVHKCARHLRGLTFETQSRLQTALNRHEHLQLNDWKTPEGITPILHPTLGTFPPAVWEIFQMLSNLRPLADVDEAVKHLKAAFAELSEHLRSVQG